MASPSRPSRLSRLLELLRYHRTDQLWHRAWKVLGQRLSAPRITRKQSQWIETATIRSDLTPLTAIARRRTQQERHFSDDLSVPEFTFLGVQQKFTWPIDWKCSTATPPTSHLWRFQLHYQDALWPLAHLESNDYPLLWKHVSDWAQSNAAPTRKNCNEGWQPFCLSRRLANWCQWWALSPPDELGRPALLHSLAKQTAYLSENLEWDLRGNHLLFNLWAIGLASAFFEGELGEHCLSLIDRWLPEQMEEQIVEGGEHFERATSYHIEVAELFLDLRDALKAQRPRLAAQCGALASQMTNLIDTISHPDGDPPLFGDSTMHVRPILQSLRRTLKNSLDPPSSPVPRARLCGDYWVWRHRDDCLIFDTGPVGADELPAHAHCDLLGFEASIGGHKLFVDSGVFSYDDDENRRYCRSSAAHNVLEIDGLSQCDVWGKFRMGYRGHPHHLDDGHEGGIWWCQAGHDAYRRVKIPLVARHFECRDDGTWSCMDVLWGTGVHQLVSRLHLHPNVKILQIQPHEARLQVGDETVLVSFEGTEGELTVAPGRYCPEFGHVIPTSTLEWRRKSIVPAVVKWTLTRVKTDESE